MTKQQVAQLGWADAIEGRNQYGRLLLESPELAATYRAAWLSAASVID